MALRAGSGRDEKEEFKVVDHKIESPLTVDTIRVREVYKVIEIPDIKYIKVDYEKPNIIIKDIETIKYIPVEENTLKYTPVEEKTIKYVTKEVECEKPIIIDKNYERPVVSDKIYERPIIKEKEYEVVTVKNLEDLQKLLDIVKALNDIVPQILTNLSTLKVYKLVEELVKVPKIDYIPTQVERIIWKDVVREKY